MALPRIVEATHAGRLRFLGPAEATTLLAGGRRDEQRERFLAMRRARNNAAVHSSWAGI
jgi:hypothetical protein